MTVEIHQGVQQFMAAETRNESAPAALPTSGGQASISCPACGGANASDAVFCSNSACRKALGEWKYVLEELKREAEWHETLAEKTVAFIGRPQFIYAHLVWFAVWALLNSGLFAFVHVIDEYPYVLLGIILAAEAIFLTGFILISSSRQNAHAEKCAELDYEVSVRTYRRIEAIDAALERLAGRLNRLETTGGNN